jgi:putative ABC transport system permease protein
MNQFSASLFFRFIVRDLFHDWVRTGLTLSGIALGVSVLLAIGLANYTALAKFKETVDLVSGKANLEIRSASTPGIDEATLSQLDWLSTIGAKYTPLIQENVVLPPQNVSLTLGRDPRNEALPNKSELVQLLGIDLLADADFKRFQTTASEGDFLSSFRPGAVLIGKRLADKYSYHIGSPIQLLINDHRKQLFVNGILSGDGLGGAFSGNCIVADISTAQAALDQQRKLTQIELIVPNEDLPWVQEKLRAELPASIEISRPEQRGEQAERITRSFEYNLTALTLIALMVGMFLIYNNMTISVIRRRPEIGTLRAIGLSRMQVLVLFAGEALFFGIVGTGLGILLGLVLADGALKAIAGTFQHFYFRDPIEVVSYNPWTICVAFLIGVGLTFLSGLAPVLEAASVMPAEAVRRLSYELKVTHLSRALSVAGLLTLLCGFGFAMLPPIYEFPIFGYVAAFTFILGFALLMPHILKFTLPWASSALQRFIHPEGKLACRSLQGALARTSVAAASLMVGIAMMISLAIMIGSFRETVTIWIDQTLKADLWLQSSARSLGSQNSRLPLAVALQCRNVQGVAAVDPFVDLPINFQGELANLGAGDFDVIRKFGHLHFTSGETNAQVTERVDDHSALVSETLAIKRQIQLGDNLTLQTPKGPLKLKVQGIYYDYASDLGYIVIPLPVYRQYYHDNTISNCAIYLTSGSNANAIREQLFQLIGDSTPISIRTTGELKKEAMRIFDRTFAITYALHTIAIIISMLAVMNALLALTMESKRDYGILRYIGASQSQIKRIVVVQAAILGIAGNVTGVALGFLLSFLLVFVINKQSFGWTVQFKIPYEFIFQSTLLVLLTALVAAIIPARNAARTLAPSVVRDE